ncbi:hypothetical protein LPJ56_000812 [Coemansia sp. RSA 2599]|nr:hypothetical protein LPJ56_000812 [Coemansia sp. RSA 2599]
MGDEYTKTLAYLCELFPEMDRDVVETVLNQNGNLTDPTVSALLNMNDPTFKPDQQDMTRQQEIQRDAEYARRLYQREVAANNYRQRQFQQQQQQQQAGPQRYGLSTTSKKSAPSPKPDGSQHTKTSTKIRNIFRLGSSSKRSASHTPPSNAEPHHYSRQQYGADNSLSVNTNRRTLDSDFDSSSDSERNMASRTPELPTALGPVPVPGPGPGPASGPASASASSPAPAPAPADAAATTADSEKDAPTRARLARNPSDVFGHLDTTNDLSSVYTPLSPSRIAVVSPDATHVPALPTRINTTSQPLSPHAVTAPRQLQQQQKQQQPSASLSPLAVTAVDVDLEHPFDTNPLLTGATPVLDLQQKDELGVFPLASAHHASTNPFKQPAVQDTNPFRSRKNTL